MKQFIRICFLVLLLMFAFSFSSAKKKTVLAEQGDYTTTNQASSDTFTLPASLQYIGEDAFEGTAGVEVVLPEGLQTIEDEAFAEMPYLKVVVIPESVQYIGKDVFWGTQDIIIYGVNGSAAEQYALVYDIVFQTIPAITPSNYGKTIRIVSDSYAALPYWVITFAFLLFVYKKGRELFETNPLDRKNRIVLHALNCYFP